MIQTKNLVKQYGSFTAVNNLNLNIPKGEIYGFLGPNGAGKTSTIMMLLGITPSTSGEIYLFEEKFGPRRLDLRKRIGMVPEKHPAGMWTWMTGVEYLQFFCRPLRTRKTDRHPRKTDRISSRTGRFERGEKQKNFRVLEGHASKTEHRSGTAP